MSTANRDSKTRLDGMVRDLRRMVEDLRTDTDEHNVLAQSFGLTPIGRLKAQLTTTLNDLRKGVHEVRKGDAGQSATQVQLRYKNTVLVVTIQELLKQFNLLAADNDTHVRWGRLFETELAALANQSSSLHTKPVTFSNAVFARAKARRDTRAAQRRLQRTSSSSSAPPQSVPLDQLRRDQEFKQEVAAKDAQMDRYLDVISHGLTELKTMAEDINKGLEQQTAMLDKVEVKVDHNTDRLDRSSNRAVTLLEENQCGVETWCPIVILVIVLLAIVGYLLTFVDQ